MTSSLQDFEAYRPLLFSIAYRMLGSAMEAEDMVQEAYLRYDRAQSVSIESPRAYLSAIITRLCLDQLKSARLQRENYVGTWLPEPLLTAPSASAIVGQRESISMAFMVLLENLSPVERAVFLLRDVFEYSYAEIAGIVGKSEVNCRRYHHRARQYIVERRPRFEPTSAEHHKLIDSFYQAVSEGNVEELTQLLAEDATAYGDGGGKTAASPHPLVGREMVIRLFLGLYRLRPPDLRVEHAEINASPALLFWSKGSLYTVVIFSVADNQIKAIHSVANPDKLTHFHPPG